MANTPDNQPTLAVDEPPAAAVGPKYTTGNIIAFIFASLLILSFFMPEGNAAPLLAWPVIIFGVVAGLSFLVKCINEASKASNVFVKVFLVLCGLGIGFVIFIVGLIAGFVAGMKDPDVRMS
jgi:hypothetical protein